jgi:5-methylcytosine-specific restriction endonuclease McrA
MRHGTGQYTKDWPEISRAVREAAGWKCVRCGRPDDKDAGFMLTVHHLSMNKSENAWHNIPALCQKCHLVVQAKVIMERNWMFDHTPWFRPYAAAYYGVRAGILPATTNYFDSLLLVRREFVETWMEFLLSLGKPQGIGV